MSWNTPATQGTVPFHQSTYANGRPTFGQQHRVPYGQQPQNPGYGHHQPGANWAPIGPPQRPPDNRPPKKKGNPVITRYPPPPGYRGPAQPPGVFGANSHFHQVQQGYSQVPQGNTLHDYLASRTSPSYSGHGYGQAQPPNWPQQPSPQTQSYVWSQNGYTAQQSYPYPPHAPVSHGPAHPSGAYSGYPPQHAPYEHSQQYHGQVFDGAPQYAQAQHTPQWHAQQAPDPQATPTQTLSYTATSQTFGSPTHPVSAVSESGSAGKPQLFLAWDDWDFDFDGAIWPKSNEPVDPSLSLGVIIWHPAKEVTRALPSTFAEAEEQSLRPLPEGLQNGDSVSVYFTAENSHEAFLDVRQTDDWELIRDDPVFVVFTDEALEQDMVPVEDCIAQRDRLDFDDSTTHVDEDYEMHDATPDIMDNLEQALSTDTEAKHPPGKRVEAIKQSNASQDDVLARLGVTGAPKPVTGLHHVPFSSTGNRSTTLPAASSVPAGRSIPPPATLSKAQSTGKSSSPALSPLDSRSHGAMPLVAQSRSHVAVSKQALSPPLNDRVHDPWNVPQRSSREQSLARGSPALSDGSNHTMVGSDFETEKSNRFQNDTTSTTPTLHRSDSSFSRKRSYEDAAHVKGGAMHQEDYSKRKRRSEVESAYSRR